MAAPASRRQTLLLIVLAAAVAVWLWGSWKRETPESKVSSQRASGTKREVAVGPVPVVHMDQLDRAVAAYDPSGRDLFKYSTRPPSWNQVKQMRAAAAAAAKAQKEAEERARVQALEAANRERERQEYERLHPTPPPPPQPPAITFRFLGFVGPPTDRIAAFEEADQTFVAKKGEIVKKEFRIDEIKYESVVISFVNPQFQGQVREMPLMRGK